MLSQRHHACATRASRRGQQRPHLCVETVKALSSSRSTSRLTVSEGRRPSVLSLVEKRCATARALRDGLLRAHGARAAEQLPGVCVDRGPRHARHTRNDPSLMMLSALALSSRASPQANLADSLTLHIFEDEEFEVRLLFVLRGTRAARARAEERGVVFSRASTPSRETAPPLTPRVRARAARRPRSRRPTSTAPALSPARNCRRCSARCTTARRPSARSTAS